MRSNRLLQIAASLEDHSEHPVARAIVARARARNLPLLPVDNLTNFPGKGVTGTVDGSAVAVGNAALYAQLHIPLPEAAESTLHPGSTIAFLAIDGTFTATFEARDSLRPSARQTVAELRNSGFKLAMITGDSAAAAAAIARELDITEVFSGLTPEGKVRIVKSLQSPKQRVAMIGDGINDAAALASADAGIAIGTGTDVAREAGDVILVRGEPGDVPGALRLARMTQRIMRQNLGWALAYNTLGIPIAAGAPFPVFGILLTPAIASAAMAFSSLSVLLNSLRLKTLRICHLYAFKYRRLVPAAIGAARGTASPATYAPLSNRQGRTKIGP